MTKATGITRLIIARHGNTFGPGETPTRVGARTDLPLVDEGRDQARVLGAYLKRHNFIPDLAFCSTLKRTQETAEIALESFGEIQLQALDIFDEIDYGPDENKTEEDVIARIGEDAIKLWNDEAVVPDGWIVNPERIIQSWKKFANDLIKNQTGKTILVITSNGVARFAPYITGDFEAFRAQHSLKLSTGALAIFEHHENWDVIDWNIKP